MARGRQMGRLKAKPLSPEIKDKYLLDWDAKVLLARPLSFPRLTSADLFANDKPLEVEIGPGSGEFLCSLASEHPGANYLGIEVSHKAARFAASLAAEHRLENVRMLRADFRLLQPLLLPESWSRVYLHFPDPPHKRKDAKRILFSQWFLGVMAFVLAAGGELSVASDKEDFFAEMLALARADARFATRQVSFDPKVKSRFQRSWELKGQFPRQFVLRKV